MKILVIGDIILDKYIFGKVDRISPEAPIIIHKHEYEEKYLGGASNLANHLSYNEKNVGICGLLGKNESSKILKKLFKNSKIIDETLYLKNYSPSIKTRFISQNQSVLRYDKEPNEIKIQLFNKIKKILDKYDIIVISDYNKKFINNKLLKKIINYIFKKKKFIAIDTKKTDLKLIKNVNLLKCNIKEAKKIFHIDNNDLINSKNINKIRILLNKFKINSAIITYGGEGSIFIDQKKLISSRTKKMFFYDLSGAGDAFFAAYIFGLSSYQSEKFCLKIANNYAERIIQNFGNNPKKIIENENKTLNYEKFSKLFYKYKNANKKIVFTNGCFDILHAGHRKLFKFAKMKGNVLFVLLNSDLSIKKLKGSNRPYNCENLRSSILSLEECVDHIFIFNEPNPIKLIERFTPDVLVKGSDYKIKDIIGNKHVTKIGGKVLRCPIIKNISTSKIAKNF